MKTTKRILAMLLALVLAIGTIPTVYAQAVPTGTACEAGQTVTIQFQYKGIAAINGTFTYSNPDLLDGNPSVTSTGLTSGLYNPNNGMVAYYGATPVDCTLTMTLKVAANAKPGDKCEITFKYESTADGDMPTTPEYKYDKVTITVKETVDYTALKAQIQKAEALKKSEYTTDSWKNLETALAAAKKALNSDSQKEVDNAAKALAEAIAALKKVTTPKVDYTELKKQISIAEGLKESDYTTASWDKLETALAAARKALSSTSQATVDTAAKNLKSAIAALQKVSQPTVDYTEVDYTELKNQIAIAEGLTESQYTSTTWTNLKAALEAAKKALTSQSQTEVDSAAANLKAAIAGLVHVDYSALIAAMQAVQEHAESNRLSELWQQMLALLERADTLLTGNDQEAINTCAQEINTLLAEILKEMEALVKVETVTVEKPVPTEPEGDYCNISMHRIWPILFWISFALNLGAIAWIVISVLRKKKKEKDDMPLVDYDITDDLE